MDVEKQVPCEGVDVAPPRVISKFNFKSFNDPLTQSIRGKAATGFPKLVNYFFFGGGFLPTCVGGYGIELVPPYSIGSVEAGSSSSSRSEGMPEKTARWEGKARGARAR